MQANTLDGYGRILVYQPLRRAVPLVGPISFPVEKMGLNSPFSFGEERKRSKIIIRCSGRSHRFIDTRKAAVGLVVAAA